MKAYIYELKNTITQERYVGSTKSAKRRRGEHFSNMRRNRHENCLVQASYDQYGEEAFEFAVLEECEDAERHSREQTFIDSGDFTFNLGKFAQGGAYDLSRHPKMDEIRANIRASKVGQGIGRKASPATCERVRQSKLGEKNYRFTGYYITPWGEFPSASQAAAASNGIMTRPTVCASCLNADRVVSATAYSKSPYFKSAHPRSIIGKTYRELGFSFRPAESAHP
ncbi:GIY-YIG nuclease family protein [Shinella sp.]|uniref:GIY-YIG nuclease family protein n=1 Tax=Shinella sp. TaxID=1870904 RepID=UPI00403545EE